MLTLEVKVRLVDARFINLPLEVAKMQLCLGKRNMVGTKNMESWTSYIKLGMIVITIMIHLDCRYEK